MVLCEVNRIEVARFYEEFLDIEQDEHSSAALVEFSHTRMDGEVCPDGGELTYVDGVVECSVHGDHKDGEDEGNDEVVVPFL